LFLFLFLFFRKLFLLLKIQWRRERDIGMGEWEWHEILDDMMMMIMRWQFFPVAMTDKSVCGFWLLWSVEQVERISWFYTV